MKKEIIKSLIGMTCVIIFWCGIGILIEKLYWFNHPAWWASYGFIVGSLCQYIFERIVNDSYTVIITYDKKTDKEN